MAPFVVRLLDVSRTTKRLFQVGADTVILIAMFALSMWIRLESWDFLTNPRVWVVLAPVVPSTIYLFIRLGFYRAVLRYIAGRALGAILVGTALSGLIMGVVIAAAALPIPRSVPVIYVMLTFFSIGGLRFGLREAINYSRNRGKERVAIYGAGSAGRQLLQVLLQRDDYLPVAFIDDARHMHGTEIGGLVVHGPKSIDKLIRNNGVGTVLLAMPSASRSRRKQILDSFDNLPIRLQSVPDLHDIISGKAQIDQIDDVGVEDLLGRDPVPPNPRLLGANIRGKSVLVTGAGGSIGSELCRQILRHRPHRLVLFDISEPALYAVEQEIEAINAKLELNVDLIAVLGCVKSSALVERTFSRFAVDTVYHAAAYKHVPIVERNIAEGVQNIVFGTRNIVETAVKCGVGSVILVSTDKSVRPTNIMGASKRMAEMICQALSANAARGGTTISMVRFGNVLGSSGSVIPLFRRQIMTGGPITVTHPEITRFFMTIPEAAQLVIQAGAMAKGGEVFVLDMGDPVPIVDLAVKMVRLHGLKPILLSEDDDHKTALGEIGIVFTKLRPGEKMHEELLIGGNPQPTRHPRIMSATERLLPWDLLAPALEEMARACQLNDIDSIRRIFVDIQTGYQPASEIADLSWVEEEAAEKPSVKQSAEARHLVLVQR